MGKIENPLGNDAISHPGLLLEKWHQEAERGRPAKEQLARATLATGDEAILRAVSERRRAVLSDSRLWRRKTAGALSLHLASSGSFENAGLCLHPLYGFAYIPGTAIKGLARAYATTVAKAAADDIEAVFGPDNIAADEPGAAGAVVFYEAWPTRWPRLEVDIVNNHHRDYYEAINDAPAEDWEAPNPVNFLTVRRGTEFEFAIAARRKDDAGAARWVELARGWVDGGLQWLGAGAKTNAGYGRFETETPLPDASGRAVFECTLKLVSPAFLAGAKQGKEDCSLRPATLRGLLRWWWRTLHSGYLDVAGLRRLEGRLWGTTERGGLISVEVEPLGVGTPKEMRVESLRGEKPARSYLAYGMEGNPNPRSPKPARFYLEAGTEWRIRIVGKERQATEQAVAALWMLCSFGGIGAKARRGFGSLESSEVLRRFPGMLKERLTAVLATAAAARPGTSFDFSRMESPSIHRVVYACMRLPGANEWAAIDSLGEAYRAFCASQKHKREKLALGLPRAIHKGVERQMLQHPAGQYNRHASPLHFRLLQSSPGQFAVQILGFASVHLASGSTPEQRFQASKDFLTECVKFMQAHLKEKTA